MSMSMGLKLVSRDLLDIVLVKVFLNFSSIHPHVPTLIDHHFSVLIIFITPALYTAS